MVARPDASVTTVAPSMLNRIPGNAGTVFTTRVTGWLTGSPGADGLEPTATLAARGGSGEASTVVGKLPAVMMARAAVTAPAPRRVLMRIAFREPPGGADR